MRNSNALLILALTGLGILVTAPVTARATAIYSYTGNNYNFIVDNAIAPVGTYTTAMSISGSFSLATALSADLVQQDISSDVLSYTFFDGRQTITEATAWPTEQFLITTDGSGNITEWHIIHCLIADCGGNTTRISTTNVGAQEQDFAALGSNQDYAHANNVPGSWTLTPEPSTGLLLGYGLVILASSKHRRTRIST